MTRLVGYQPQYFPRLHYYARFLNADIFKISDNLQYVRRHSYHSEDGSSSNGPSYQAHAPIKTSQGSYLLDVPVRHEGRKTERTMDSVKIDYSTNWREKQLKSIEMNYKKAPRFPVVFPELVTLFSHQFPSLGSYTIMSTLWGLLILFEIPIGVDVFSLAELNSLLPFSHFRLKKVVRMSEMGMHRADKVHGENVNDWIIAQCRALGADEYYFGGTAALAYIDRERLSRAGIRLVQQDWMCATYTQQFPKHGFLPNLSILDLLMNEPPERAREILATPGQ